MRKLLFLIGLFVILTSCSKGQIGWGSLTSTQWVSFQDAASSGIYQKYPIPNGLNWMTKQAILYYLDVDPSFISSYADNQWIPKIDLVANGHTPFNTLSWSFTEDSWITDAYMTIQKNYTLMFTATTSQSSSFTVNDGDNIIVTVRSANSGSNGNGATINVAGNNGLSYNSSISGYTQTITYSFTWHSVNDAVVVQGIIEGSGAYYTSNAYSFDRIKSDCPSGYAGSIVTYSISAGKYGSFLSQADADNQAYLDVYYNSQAYANTNGSCTVIPSGGSGCTNSLTVSYNPSPAQDYGDRDVYLAYIAINGYVMDSKETHNISIHDGDSIVLKIHMPPSDKGITGVNINYKDDSNKPLLNIAKVIVDATGGLAGTVLSLFNNFLSFELAKGTTTNIHSVTSDPYDIWVREKYSCDKGNVKIIINNMIDL
jgi:hypothetical protein